MCIAGYRGPNRIYEAVRDIEEHAEILKSLLAVGGASCTAEDRRQRILGEYERIAFAAEDEGIRTADKLKALEMYRLLSEGTAGTEAAATSLTVAYDYGKGEDEG